MKTKNRYAELKRQNINIDDIDVFFAFSDKQFAEGEKKIRKHTDAEIFRGYCGMFGTNEGLKEYNRRIDEHIKQFHQCSPQEVYEYEYYNHECGYTGDDEEALEIVIDLFGDDVINQIRRMYCDKYINS